MEHRVVITGIGALTPVGHTARETWESLKAGVNGVGFITRFDTTEYKVKVAAEIKDFDPASRLPKSELRHNDRATQYALIAADEAIEDSGLVIEGSQALAQKLSASSQDGQADCLTEEPAYNISPERIGTYVGSGIGGFETMIEQICRWHDSGPRKVSSFMIPAMIANMPAGMVSIRHHLLGPTLPIVTACATSAHEVGEAFRAVKLGLCDAVLAGGTEASVVPASVAGFTSCMALSKNPDPATACRPFDLDRDGFVMGEGAAMLVLEDLDHALARGARIYAEVVGYGNTADAYHMTSPDPSANGVARCIKDALREAGIDGETAVSHGLYINAHGTSTQLNDATETLGFKLALGEDTARKASISSTKSMTGHMLGATGALEAIVCALALRDGAVPPTIGLANADPACDLDYTPGTKAANKELTWALSTNLGFGGHNACLAFKRYV